MPGAYEGFDGPAARSSVCDRSTSTGEGSRNGQAFAEQLDDSEGRIKKFSAVLDLLTEFFEIRLRYYVKRKEYHVDRLQKEKDLIDAKVRFILMVIKGELVVAKRKREELIADLKGKGFKPYHQIFGRRHGEEDDEPSASSKETQAKEPKSGFDYLLGMPIWSLTWERVEDLRSGCRGSRELADASPRSSCFHK
eukprot:g24574.t1